MSDNTADVTDVTIVRDGTQFLVRGITPEGQEFCDAMWGIIVDRGTLQQTGVWPERDGAKIVQPRHLGDDVFEQAEAWGVTIRML
jgi:hypothetical protein